MPNINRYNNITWGLLLDRRLKEVFVRECTDRCLRPQAVVRKLIDDLLTDTFGLTKEDIYGPSQDAKESK